MLILNIIIDFQFQLSKHSIGMSDCSYYCLIAITNASRFLAENLYISDCMEYRIDYTACISTLRGEREASLLGCCSSQSR